MFRCVWALACALLLAACSPEFDWRSVHVADGVVSGVLPGKPQSDTRQVMLQGHAFELTLTMAQAGKVLFALGRAPLPEALAADSQAQRDVADAMMAALYQNLGAQPPEPLPPQGQRFLIEGHSGDKPMRMEAIVVVGRQGLVEAIVTGEPAAIERAPVADFWSALRLPPAR